MPAATTSSIAPVCAAAVVAAATIAACIAACASTAPSPGDAVVPPARATTARAETRAAAGSAAGSAAASAVEVAAGAAAGAWADTTTVVGRSTARERGVPDVSNSGTVLGGGRGATVNTARAGARVSVRGGKRGDGLAGGVISSTGVGSIGCRGALVRGRGGGVTAASMKRRELCGELPCGLVVSSTPGNVGGLCGITTSSEGRAASSSSMHDSSRGAAPPPAAVRSTAFASLHSLRSFRSLLLVGGRRGQA